MKKMTALFLALLMMLSLVACGGSKDSGVKITLPAELMGETTQEDLDEAVAEGEFLSAVLNEDGTVTCEMSKSKHKELMKAVEAEINKALEDMIGSAEFPNITNIEHEDDYSSFTVTTKSTELDMAESISVLAFYMYGGMYGACNGDTDVVIKVSFVNADTGDTIESFSSDQMGQ